jgi:hypothetical protein
MEDDPPFVLIVRDMGDKLYGPFPTWEAASAWGRENFPDTALAVRGLIPPEDV